MMKNSDQVQVNSRRLQEEFMELTSIDSVSFQERLMADRLKEKLLALGFEVREDQTGERYHGNAGNVYGYLKGTVPGPGVLLSAHMDTVQPGLGKKAVLREDGVMTSESDTVLGADDVSGITEILEGIRSLQEAGIPHRDVEVLFPVAEELYTKGSREFDFSQIRSREAYVLDLSGPVGTAALRAPTLISFTVQAEGKAAHAGFNPEDGIHAIRTVCRAAAKLQQGYVDEETTLNIGLISGGEAGNIVPASCSCTGEIRSYSHEKALEVMRQVEETFRMAAEEDGASVTFRSTIDLTAYQVDREAPVAEHFCSACERLGIPCTLTSTFGGSDNHNFMYHGIPGIVLSCGMYEVHSVREYTRLQDLELGARLVAELIRMPS